MILIQGLNISFSRNWQDRLRNRFRASFRMAANAKRTPQLTWKVKNCHAPQNKINSAMFWQKSYRLEWYLIIWHYLNLYVYSISFMARLFLLWKLTGAKFHFESMFQQELKFCWIYVGNIFLKFRVIDGEYIVKISRGIIKHVYEVMTFRYLKVRHKVPLITI